MPIMLLQPCNKLMHIYNINSSIHSTDLGLCLSQEQEKGYHLDRLPVHHIYAFIHTLESPPDPEETQILRQKPCTYRENKPHTKRLVSPAGLQTETKDLLAVCHHQMTVILTVPSVYNILSHIVLLSKYKSSSY